VSKVQATGQVYHLRQVADFAGTYVAVGADAAVVQGAGLLTMRNQHGVVINIQSVQQGVKLTAGGEGIAIKLNNSSTRP
jgi:vancomycin resistance protein YoaR